MSIRRSVLAATLAIVTTPAFARPDCAAAAEHALHEGVALYPALRARIIGQGRAWFHRGPDAACRESGLFVIPGDVLVAYVPWKDWVQVRYVAHDGTAYLTWLQADRVQLLGPVGP